MGCVGVYLHLCVLFISGRCLYLLPQISAEMKPNPAKKKFSFYCMQLQLIVSLLLQPIRGIVWVCQSVFAFQALEGTRRGAATSCGL